ncbi:MAG: SDR family oxidoreductase [Nannocystaceae bacterium]
MAKANRTGRGVLIVVGVGSAGLAVSEAFVRAGDQVFLLCDPSAEREVLEAISEVFDARDLVPPSLVCADLNRSQAADTALARVREQCASLDVLVIASERARGVAGLAAQNLQGMSGALEAGSWPLIAGLHAIHRVFGDYPRHAIALSDDASDLYEPAGAYRAISSAVLETFTRYMATHLREHGVLVNAVRVPPAWPTSAASDELETDQHAARAELGQVVVVLCSGLLDAMSGQVVTMDHGRGFGGAGALERSGGAA